MKRTKEANISVLIPAFNAELTIETTLRSVINQTMQPEEIVVMDDGSTDSTAAVVEAFAPSVKLLREDNKGVHVARSALFRVARGDLIAFLDHDDLWHPKYLEVQYRMYQRYPNAVVYYTAHQPIRGNQQCFPKYDILLSKQHTLIEPRDFLLRYNRASGFILPSFCVFRAKVLKEVEENRFGDVYMWYRLALLGPFIESHATLGAYRLTETSLSSDRVWAYRGRVSAMEQIIELYEEVAPASMLKIAKDFLAASYRQYAKQLMGTGNVAEARRVFQVGLRSSFRMKTLILLITTFFPMYLQPKWAQPRRRH